MVTKFKVGETYESRGAGPGKVLHVHKNGILTVLYDEGDYIQVCNSNGTCTSYGCAHDLLPRKRKVRVWTTVWLTPTGYAFADCATGKRVGDRRGDNRCIRETREEVFEVEDYK